MTGKDDREATDFDLGRRIHLEQLRRDPGLRDPSAMPELSVLFSALRRGTKRSKLRLLVIACCNRHQLAEVFGTSAGPVIIASGRRVEDCLIGGLDFGSPQGPREVLGDDPLDYELTAERGNHRQPVACRVEDVYAVPVQCRCQEAIIPIAWVTDHLAAKHRHVIWTDPHKSE